MAAAYAFDFSKTMAVNLTFATTKKTGNQPYSMSFAFNNANELPMPLNHRTNEFGVERFPSYWHKLVSRGKDTVIENNIFVDCRPALHIDARATGWAGYHVDTTMTQRLPPSK